MYLDEIDKGFSRKSNGFTYYEDYQENYLLSGVFKTD